MIIQNSKVIKYLIGLILIALPSYLIRFEILGIPTTVLEIAIYLLVIGYWILVIRGGANWQLPPRRWFWPIALFILGAFIGVLVSPDKRIALGQFKGFIFDPLLFGLVLYSALRSKIVDRDWMVKLFIWLGIGLAFLAWTLPSDDQNRAFSIFAYEVTPSANYLALVIVPILVLTASKITLEGGIAFVLMLLGLLSSDSRGGMLGLGLGLLYLVYHKVKKPVFKQAVITIGVAAVFFVGYFARPDLSATPDSGRIASSNNIRYEIWTTTKEILTKDTKNFFFGVGLGNYQRYFTDLTNDRVNYPEFIAPKALTPHNIFLAMWVNGGLVMLAGFAWLLYLVFRRGRFLPAQAALVALIGHGLVDTPYFKNDLSILFWALVILTLDID